MNRGWIAIVFCCASLAWPETPGTGQPLHPNRQLVENLRANRKGQNVSLSWSQPRGGPSDQEPVSITVCREISKSISNSPAPAPSARPCARSVGNIDLRAHGAAKSAKNGQLEFTDILPEELENSASLQFAKYSLELHDAQGHTAGFSNAVSIPLAITVPSKQLHSELDVAGVFLIWEDDPEASSPLLQFDYRVYRKEKGTSKAVPIPYTRAIIHTMDGERRTAVDMNVEWEKSYVYWVTPITKVYSPQGEMLGEIEGESSDPIDVVTHDVFPPAVPQSLLALMSAMHGHKFVDLTWPPSREKDLAGYNIYRRKDDSPFVRLNARPITMISFHDVDITSGHKYFYALTAVDRNGNESARSAESAEQNP